MECFFPFIMLVFVIGLLATLASRAQARADRWNRSYNSLAQRYGGVCSPAGWFGRPSVRFNYGPAAVLLNTQSSPEPCTQLTISWPDPMLRAEIFSRWEQTRRRRIRGMSVVDIPDDAFDRRFTIQANDEAELQSLLSEGVRWQLDRLVLLHKRKGAHVSIHRGRMIVRKPSMIRGYRSLEEFVQIALGLYDQAMLTRSSGIAFVADSVISVNDEAICQICGESIVSDMVFCRRCDTPHHKECWHFNGVCSVYGCQEQRYVTPRIATPPKGSRGG